MKRYLLLILFLLGGLLPSKADVLATQTFQINADTTMTVNTAGIFSSTITGTYGLMSTPLNINFNIATNQDVNDVRLKAIVVDALGGRHSALTCGSGAEQTSQSVEVVLANELHQPSAESITACKKPTCISTENPDAIAYPGTVTINNNGTIQYKTASDDDYINAKIKAGTTDINLTLLASPKEGTYSSTTALDQPDNYKVEVYLDNIPVS